MKLISGLIACTHGMHIKSVMRSLAGIGSVDMLYCVQHNLNVVPPPAQTVDQSTYDLGPHARFLEKSDTQISSWDTATSIFLLRS